MKEFERGADLAGFLDRRIGTSDWLTVDQAMIDGFAAVTGDRQWIHVDTARAARELPGGRTIAHGYLVLALVGTLSPSIYRILNRSRVVNYGSDRVRFIHPVQAGARIRLHQGVKALAPVDGGVRVTFDYSVEIEGESRPALSAEAILLVYD